MTPRFRRRRKERGAVFIEALLVLGLQIIICTAAVFFNKLYTGSLAAEHEAKAAAFHLAKKGCGSGADHIISDPDGAVSAIPTETSDDASWMGSFGTESGAGTRDSATFFGKTWTIKNNIVATCNEADNDQAPADKLDFGWALDKSLGGTGITGAF